MKKILLMLPLLFWLGCEDDDATDDTNPLIGEWDHASVYGEVYDSDTDTLIYTWGPYEDEHNETIKFEKDKTFSYQSQNLDEDEWYSGSGTWEISDNELTVIILEYQNDYPYNTITGNEEVAVFPFSIDNDILTVEKTYYDYYSTSLRIDEYAKK